MPQIRPLEAGQALALALEDATGEMNLRNTEAEQRRAIYALCASCSDVEAGDVVRAIARTLYQAGVRESADDEVRVRLASPVPGDVVPPSSPANDGALPLADPNAPVVLEHVPGGVVVALTPAAPSSDRASSPTEPPPRDGVA